MLESSKWSCPAGSWVSGSREQEQRVIGTQVLTDTVKYEVKKTTTEPWQTSTLRGGHRKRRLLARETEEEQSEK